MMSEDSHIPKIGDRFERIVILTDKNWHTKEWKKTCKLIGFKKANPLDSYGQPKYSRGLNDVPTAYEDADSFEDCDVLVFQPETNENIPFWQSKEDYPTIVNSDPPKANTFQFVIYKLIS